MKSLHDMGRKFSNRREWRDFLAAVQCSVNYPKVLNALRTSALLFNDSVVAPMSTSVIAGTPVK